MASHHENEAMQKLIDSAIVAFPSGAMAALGWLAHTLAKDDPLLPTRKFVGGLMLSAFVGWGTCNLLMFCGVHAELAATLSSVIGASGAKGWEWLLSRARNLAGKGSNDG